MEELTSFFFFKMSNKISRENTTEHELNALHAQLTEVNNSTHTEMMRILVKMAKDIKCMKYEIKKLKLKVNEPFELPEEIVRDIRESKETSSKAYLQSARDHEQLEDLERRLREASQAAAEANSKAADAQTKTEELAQENQKMNDDIKVIKYELKRLRDKVRDLEAVEIPSVPDDLLERVNAATAKATQASSDANDASSNARDASSRAQSAQSQATAASSAASAAQAAASEAGSRVQQLQAENEKLRNDLKCLKYEVKKLKEKPEPEPVEREVPVIPDELYERVDKAESQSTQAADRANRADSKATEAANKARDAQSVAHDANSRIAEITKENDKLKSDMACLKYEVKKLKDAPAPEQQPVVIPDEFVNQIKDAQSQSTRAYDKASQAHRDITSIQTNSTETKERVETLVAENQKLKDDIKCMKYEVKKILGKVQDIEDAPKEREVSIPGDLLSRVEEATNKSSKASDKADGASSKAQDASYKADLLKVENEKLRNDLKCLKYEVKKLKENQKDQDVKETRKINNTMH